jgi:hypothetical protein
LIGTASGAPVDLRYFFDVSGVVDTGIQPFSVNSKGELIQINAAYGVQADFGVYGVHRWSHATLGLDYKGNVYEYANDSFYDGSSHNLKLGYTYQESRRLVFNAGVTAGTSSLGYGSPGFYSGVATNGSTDVVNTPTSTLFDNRIYYLEPSADMSFIQSARTTYTIGGDGYFIRREATGLASLNGYNLHGTIRHRLSRTESISVTYEHLHYDFPPSYGQSDANVGQVGFDTSLGRRWTFGISGGVFQSEVQGVEQVAINPVIAALLGTSVGEVAFYRVDYYPSGNISFAGHFKHSVGGISAGESIMPGNGVYLTSRLQSAQANYSYTGLHKWNIGMNAGYFKLASIGQAIQPYEGFNGGVGVTYSLTRGLHIIARADSRYQQIDVIGYNRTGYRATLGLGFSPGNVPLSLW